MLIMLSSIYTYYLYRRFILTLSIIDYYCFIKIDRCIDELGEIQTVYYDLFSCIERHNDLAVFDIY